MSAEVAGRIVGALVFSTLRLISLGGSLLHLARNHCALRNGRGIPLIPLFFSPWERLLRGDSVMTEQIPLDPHDRADIAHEGGIHEVTPDLGYQRLAIVNVAFFGAPNAASGKWVLIDAGVVGTAGRTGRAAAK